MLNISKPNAPVSPVGQEYTSAEQSLQSLKELISRHLYLLISVVLVCLLLGVIFLATTPPRYTATGLLIIDTKKSQTIQQQAPLGLETPVDTGTVDSQVEILKSESIALAVIKQLHLTEEDEFVGPGGGVPGALIGFISRLLSDGSKSQFELTRKALEKFQRRLAVKRLGLSYVIEIDYQSVNPDRAARIANAVAEAYIDDSLEAKYQASRRAAVWLQDRLKDLRVQASSAERAVVQYKADNNIVDTGGRLLGEQQLAEINSALTIARAQKGEAQARLDRITGILNKDNGSDGSLVSELGTVADTLRNDVITRLRQQYLDLANREADWSNRYGPTHLAVKNLRDQMREIRRSIADELKRIAESYKSDYEIAAMKEESTQKNLDQTVRTSNDTNQAQIALRELESNAQSYRALADNFLQLYMVSVQQQSFPITKSRLITQATPPVKPTFPNILVVLPGALVGGLALAFGLAVFRDMSDRAFRTGSQVQRELGTDCIAVLPKLFAAGNNRSTGLLGIVRRLYEPRSASEGDLPASKPYMAPAMARAGSGGNSARQLIFRPSPMRYVMEAPFSRFSEGLRAVKLAADLHSSNRKNNVLGITSALPNEGKSSVAASLARVIAHGGTRTLLVDGDLRNPSLTRQLAPSAQVGLVDVILGRAALADAIWTDPETGLEFLPAVIDQRLPHSHEILLWQSTEKLFAALRGSYDRVILDLPPLAPIVDVRATNRLVNSYLLVIEWGRTKIDVVKHALNDAPNVNERNIGCVLNKADIKAISRYDGRHSEYYYNSKYSRYGYVD